jgi:HAD superfamily phosphoserine phosphatase-like hydrolase
MTLVAFDFDGTLSDSEMTVLLGEQAGVAAEIAAITDAAMAGELSYAASLRERVQLLSGLSTVAMEAAFAQVRLHPGAGALLGRLRAAGVPVVILTGGFERGVDAALAAADAAVDAVVANRLVAPRWRRCVRGGGRRQRTPSPSVTVRTTCRCSRPQAPPSATTPSRWSRPPPITSSTTWMSWGRCWQHMACGDPLAQLWRCDITD